MICKSCKKKEAIEYEELGLGEYCQDCLDKESRIWLKESGFDNEN